MSNDLLPLLAQERLKGAVVADFEEDGMQSMSIIFSKDDVLNITAMPFSDPELDVQLIEGAR